MSPVEFRHEYSATGNSHIDTVSHLWYITHMGIADFTPLSVLEQRLEREHEGKPIATILRDARDLHGAKRRAARSLGIGRMTLYRLIAKHGIDWPTNYRVEVA